MWCALAVVDPAQAAGEKNPFRLEVQDTTLAPGASGKATVVLVVPAKHHVFRDMLDVSVTDAAGLTVGAVSYPPGIMKPDTTGTNGGQPREEYEDDVFVEVPLTAPADAAQGKHVVDLHVRYQGCNQSTCYFPQEADVAATVTVAGVPVVGAPPAPSLPASAPAEELAVRILAAPGSAPGTFVVRFDLQGEWHVNRDFVSLAVPADGSPGHVAGVSVGTVDLPRGVESGKAEDFTLREDYVADTDITFPVTVPAGVTEFSLDVGYQACKGASLCRMPTVETVKVAVTGAALPPLEPSAATHAAADPAPGVPVGAQEDMFAAARSKGILPLVLLCFVAGLGVSLTPCVLPMVPITMGVLGARSAGSRLKALSLSGTYVLGLASVYTGLGVFAGVTGALFGSWLQSPWVVGSIAAFLFVMGLSMFGLFEVGVPSALQSRLSGKGGGGSYGGALVLGMIGAVLAGPCSGPVVASVLALIGQGGEVALGAGLMFAFSLGMGMIFLVTGAMTGWLPSRGPWMATVKKAFGLIMWAGAVYFAEPQLPGRVTAFIVAFMLLVTAVFAWPDPDDGEGFVLTRLRMSYSVIGGLIGGVTLIGALLGPALEAQRVALGASAGSGSTNQGPKVVWLASEAEAVAKAQAEGKPLVIDFTADWCAACHELEKFTFSENAVATEITSNYVALRIDCTDKGDEVVKALQKKYGVTGLPTVVFAKPDGTAIDHTVGFVEAPDFLPRLTAARAKVGG